MIKKKTKRRVGQKKVAGKNKKKTAKRRRGKREMDPAKVRQEIACLVKSDAKGITKAVIDQAIHGQLAPAKYLFEMAGVYPPLTDGSQATTEEDSLAKTLLTQLNIPCDPVRLDGNDEDVMVMQAKRPAAAPEGRGEAEEEVDSREEAGPGEA